MAKCIYFDCFSGISGNMILGALFSLGLDPVVLKSKIEKLNVSEFDFEISDTIRAGIAAKHLKTIYPEGREHRHLGDISKIIENSSLSSRVKDDALRVFKIIAEAEARVHGIEVEEVHFHEIGAMDSIIDIVGICIGFEILGVRNFLSSSVNVGSGFVEIDHGNYPVPPPAVVEILRDVPCYSNGIKGELTTPTGAAILKAFCENFGDLEDFKASDIGYGAGTRDYEKFPNVLRILIGERSQTPPDTIGQDIELIEDLLILLECNVDDSSPEMLGHFMDRALEIGATDCWFSSVHMKKNRPGTLISVLCTPEKQADLLELFFLETTTIGVRLGKQKRACLKREIVWVETKFGAIPVKVSRFKGKIANAKPEFEELRKASEDSGEKLLVIEREVLSLFWESIADGK